MRTSDIHFEDRALLQRMSKRSSLSTRNVTTAPACHLFTMWLALLCGALAGCEHSGEAVAEPPPWVLSVALEPVSGTAVIVSGTVRARFETLLSFEVGGRIAARLAGAGDKVVAGQLLYRLEPGHFEQAVRAAEADLAAAQAARTLHSADLARAETLFGQGTISRQALQREQMAGQQARAQEQAAAARLQQARNALGYTRISARQEGVLIEVTGEPGQVVAAGEPVGRLGSGAVREVEVFLPERLRPPASGLLQLDDHKAFKLTLREAAGAADAASRTWRARYQLPKDAPQLPLGTVVRARFDVPQSENGQEAEHGDTTTVYNVPLSAIDERGEGPRIWRVTGDGVQSVPVRVLALEGDTARVQAPLPPEARIVAVGGHLLRPGMAVRERRQ